MVKSIKKYYHMDKGIARKLITLTAMEKKERNALKQDDFKNILVFKRKIMKEDDLEKFIHESIAEGLLSKAGEKLQINFNTSGVEVTLDMSFEMKELFQDKPVDLSITDRMLDLVVSSGILTKRETLERMKKQLPGLIYIDNTVRLGTLMNDLFINFDELKKEMSKDLMGFISHY
jgi:hypothetical protein